MQWVSQITSIAIGMVLPGLFGFWIDWKLGTKAVFPVVGVVVGFSVGLWQLIKLTKKPNRDNGSSPKGPEDV